MSSRIKVMVIKLHKMNNLKRIRTKSLKRKRTKQLLQNNNNNKFSMKRKSFRKKLDQRLNTSSANMEWILSYWANAEKLRENF